MHTYAQADFLTLDQVEPLEFSGLVKLSLEMRNSTFAPAVLNGQSIVLLFEKPSLRTRVTFEVAVRRLGGWPILLAGSEARLGQRESIPDMARNLSLWVDGIIARVY